MLRRASMQDLSAQLAHVARAARETLRGVSPERVLAELRVIFESASSARALDLLESAGLLQRAVPGLWPESDPTARPAAWSRTRRMFAAFGAPPGLALGLAALIDPPRLEVVEALRASRAVQARVREIWELAAALGAPMSRAVARSQRIRWMRSAGFDDALVLARARAGIDGADTTALDEIARERAELGEAELQPERWITSRDIEAAGVARGPAWSRLLEEAETLQLDRRVASRDEALAWLRRRVESGAAPGHDGGNTPRRK